MAVAPTNGLPSPSLSVREYFSAAPASSPSPKRGSITLAWDASTGGDIAGYRLLYGTNSFGYTHSATITNISKTNTITARLEGLDEGVTYYAACVSFNSLGIESVPSNEVSFTTKHYINLRQFAYAVEAFGVYGQTNEIKMSTNLLSWWTVMTFVGDGSLQTYVHTNAMQAWFKVEVK